MKTEQEEFLIRELDNVYRQLKFVKDNKENKTLPVKLANKIAYLRGYATAIRAIRTGYLDDGTPVNEIMRQVKLDFWNSKK